LLRLCPLGFTHLIHRCCYLVFMRTIVIFQLCTHLNFMIFH
jgi:hypothetical protein